MIRYSHASYESQLASHAGIPMMNQYSMMSQNQEAHNPTLVGHHFGGGGGGDHAQNTANILLGSQNGAGHHNVGEATFYLPQHSRNHMFLTSNDSSSLIGDDLKTQQAKLAEHYGSHVHPHHFHQAHIHHQHQPASLVSSANELLQHGGGIKQPAVDANAKLAADKAAVLLVKSENDNTTSAELQQQPAVNKNSSTKRNEMVNEMINDHKCETKQPVNESSASRNNKPDPDNVKYETSSSTSAAAPYDENKPTANVANCENDNPNNNTSQPSSSPSTDESKKLKNDANDASKNYTLVHKKYKLAESNVANDCSTVVKKDSC